MEELMFFECKQCGNLVELIADSGMPMECCGEQMEELFPHTYDTGSEKHLPEVMISGNKVEVAIGMVPHPMTAEHYIEWTVLQTDHCVMRHQFKPGDEPKTTFMLNDGEIPIAVYEYCNVHGLWKTTLVDDSKSRMASAKAEKSLASSSNNGMYKSESSDPKDAKKNSASCAIKGGMKDFTATKSTMETSSTQPITDTANAKSEKSVAGVTDVKNDEIGGDC